MPLQLNAGQSLGYTISELSMPCSTLAVFSITLGSILGPLIASTYMKLRYLKLMVVVCVRMHALLMWSRTLGGTFMLNISVDAAGPETAFKTQLNNSLVRCISPIVRFSLGVYGICYFSNGVCSDCFSHSQSLEQHWNKKGSTGGRKDTNVMRENQDAHQTVACPAKLVLPLQFASKLTRNLVVYVRGFSAILY